MRKIVIEAEFDKKKVSINEIKDRITGLKKYFYGFEIWGDNKIWREIEFFSLFLVYLL